MGRGPRKQSDHMTVVSHHGCVLKVLLLRDLVPAEPPVGLVKSFQPSASSETHTGVGISGGKVGEASTLCFNMTFINIEGKLYMI